MDVVNNVLQRVGSTEPTTLLRDFNKHIGTDSEIWKGVIGTHGDPAFNEKGGIYCSFAKAMGSAL